ncbi:hypothetical protein [Streptomyces sp. NPDC059010]|uniref:hypothetical protein n=1 Tax=Streptomyces sp. NPDC059010 TaxID=3346695 RepID=UPI0036A826FE
MVALIRFGCDGDVHKSREVTAQALVEYFDVLSGGQGVVEHLGHVVQQSAAVERLPRAYLLQDVLQGLAIQ